MGVLFRVNVGESMSVSELLAPSRRMAVATGESVSVSDSVGRQPRAVANLSETTGLVKPDTDGAGNDFIVGLMNRIRALGGTPDN